MKGLFSLAAAAASLVVSGSAEAASGDRLNFLACPQLYDTLPMNCWAVEYNGERYFIGAQRGPDSSYLPQMKHQVLVEGVVTDAPRVCGGIVLSPLRVSVLPELDLSCDGPVLSGDGLTPPTVAGRSARTPLKPHPLHEGIGSFMLSNVPEPPYTTKQFRIDFDFGTDLLVDQMQKRMIEIWTYTKLAGTPKITVEGYTSTTLLSDGNRLAEPEGLAERRAKKISGMLENLGAPNREISVTWAASPEEPDGVHDAERRRVIVTIEP